MGDSFSSFEPLEDSRGSLPGLPPRPALLSFARSFSPRGHLLHSFPRRGWGQLGLCSPEFEDFLSWNNELIPALVSRPGWMSHAEHPFPPWPSSPIFPGRGDSRQLPQGPHSLWGGSHCLQSLGVLKASSPPLPSTLLPPDPALIPPGHAVCCPFKHQRAAALADRMVVFVTPE